ncbi:Protein required for attachment to host cells [Mariprofundus ferrinatatus]|uniref:Protein required for attachment to host cells n=1 Tax=Mariprofundus ferrinatatus TaxID=1921087 RepID=A0A2K8L3T1_9PROT|nr:host attachment protein [Mariprofundus ferrinatatus]ATX81762.1 Protein required for attachment to host cells [Mariprofundus ferrinatatus]
MAKTWVVVADSSRARVMMAEKPGMALSEVGLLEHPEGRLHEQELTTDLPGKAFDSIGEGRHSMGSSVDPKKHEAIKFAKQVVDYLETGRNSGSFEKLYLVAPPAFLGLLREQLPAPLERLVKGSVDKNLVAHNVKNIREHLPEHL